MCAKEGKKVAVLEKYVLYNASGSSADFMRMFRTMYTKNYMVSSPDLHPNPNPNPHPHPHHHPNPHPNPHPQFNPNP